MKIYLGLEFDSTHYPSIVPDGKGLMDVDVMNLSKFFDYLELRLGLTGLYVEEHLRIEEYRVALSEYSLKNPNAFFAKSFIIDPLSVTKHLLTLRDELAHYGFDFSLKDAPNRLKVFCELEKISKLSIGRGERFQAIFNNAHKLNPHLELILIDPTEHFPPYWQKLIKMISNVNQYKSKLSHCPHDLNLFKTALKGEKIDGIFKGDGSLEIYFYNNEYTLSRAIPSLLKNEIEALVYIPKDNHLVDEALKMSSLTTLGSKLESSQRPLLELIKLVPLFLFEPINPEKLMEFFLIPVSPINKRLASKLVDALSKSPGIGGPAWKEALEKCQLDDKKNDFEKWIKELDFYLSQEKTSITNPVAINSLVKLYEHLKTNFQKKITDDDQNYKLLVALLSDLIILLNTRGKTEPLIDKLGLESLLSNFLPSLEITNYISEVGPYQSLRHVGCLYDEVSTFFWIGLLDERGSSKALFWNHEENEFLKMKDIEIHSSAYKNALALERETNALLKVKDKLVFFIPEGSVDSLNHPFYQILEGYFEDVLTLDGKKIPNIKNIIKDLDSEKIENFPERLIPKRLTQINLPLVKSITKDEHSYSSLYELYFKPFEWVLKRGAALYPSSIASIEDSNTLYGNLAHRTFERFFENHPDLTNLKKGEIEKWVKSFFKTLFQEEGSNLLLPENSRSKIYLENTILSSLPVLVSSLQKDSWEVVGIEKEIKGTLFGQKVTSKIDLLLKRKNEFAVIDYKWSGFTKKLSDVGIGADLQLAIYSKLSTEDSSYAHTAYFIIDEAKLIAKDNKAFSSALLPRVDDTSLRTYADIIALMENTFEFRMKELGSGFIDLDTNEKEKKKQFDNEELVPYPDTIYLDNAFLTFLGWEPGHD